MTDKSKNIIIKQYENKKVNIDDLIESLIEDFQIDNYNIDIAQARLIINYLLAKRKLSRDEKN